MATPVQDSLVPYTSAYDIVIPRGPAPVPALKARDNPTTEKPTPYIRQRVYSYRPAEASLGAVYDFSGKPSALAAATVGRIIDIHA